MAIAAIPLRFVCDHDVAADVARCLRKMGHDAWTAWQAAMSDVPDDVLAVYTDEKNAIIVTHDREFSQRRRRFVTTRHIWLDCNEWDAAGLLQQHLPDFERVLSRRDKPAFLTLTTGRAEVYFGSNDDGSPPRLS